ncbi:MAG: helix-turn-helix domain-containing protein [Cyclobacteriaceae bacterium]|nr:helix-turn-helix domain-containing protein [Cyclobacteriaceae bacterium]
MSEIIITTISKSEIQKFIESAVEKVMLKKSTKDNNQNDAFLDVDQAATFLGIAKATLYGKCSKLIIPHFKKGKKLYFHQSELMEYLKSGRRKTVQDIQQNVNTQLSEKGEHYNARRSYR